MHNRRKSGEIVEEALQSSVTPVQSKKAAVHPNHFNFSNATIETPVTIGGSNNKVPWWW